MWRWRYSTVAAPASAMAKVQKQLGLRPKLLTAREIEMSATENLKQQISVLPSVFKGINGLQGLVDADGFWLGQPYGTRLYYGSISSKRP